MKTNKKFFGLDIGTNAVRLVQLDNRNNTFPRNLIKYAVMPVESKIIFSDAKIDRDGVLFGFENIQGFPLEYNTWEFILMAIQNANNFETQNQKIIEFMNDMAKDYKESDEEPDEEMQAWLDASDLDSYLKKRLFIEKNQVVVPSLNLKAAKKIICRNERDKKALRKMGFIEDRIQIKNFKHRNW